MDTSDRKHFTAIPWCARHLEGDRVVARTSPCRIPKPTGEDALFADTLSSDKTIVRMLQFYEEPLSPTEPVNEVKVFLTLGGGLNGYPNVCHGGIVTTIIDEVLGGLLSVNQDRKTLSAGAHVTAYLNTSYIKPVPTPATVLARARFIKAQGRKYFAQGTIENEDGVVLARADGLFVQPKSTL